MSRTKGFRRNRLITDDKPNAAEKAVKAAAGGAEQYADLRVPSALREFLQSRVVQRYRERRDLESVALGRSILGLVFEDGSGQFHDIAARDWIEVKSETAMVAAWLAVQAKKKNLFQIALKELRELDDSCENPLANLYRLHIECVGAELNSSKFGTPASFDCRPDAAYHALKARFKGMSPLPNVVRAVTLRYARSLANTHPDFDRTPAFEEMTLHQWLISLRDEGLNDEIRNDDGFVVGSVAIIETAEKYLDRALAAPRDIDEAQRCYGAACQAYTEAIALFRAGKVNESSNARSQLGKADALILVMRARMKNSVDQKNKV